MMPSLDTLKADLAARADALLADLLGEPSFRNPREWRWGRHGSLSYSPHICAYYDHEQQRGGSLLDLIADRRACSIGQAADFAREWLGGHIHLEPRPVPPPVIRADTLAAARVLWNAVRPIAATAAAAYLDRRRIVAPALDSLGLVPAGAFASVEPMAWWRWPALALLLTTADRKAAALQLVALHDDGRPVVRDGRKIKRTVGPMAAAAFRMPGRPHETGPLILAEGPETALACWQSSGVETWALCGSIARAVLSSTPVSRPIVVCADDDPADAPAAVAVSNAVARWRTEGRPVHVAYPWQERRHDKSDFADVLASAGTATVRWRIMECLP